MSQVKSQVFNFQVKLQAIKTVTGPNASTGHDDSSPHLC